MPSNTQAVAEAAAARCVTHPVHIAILRYHLCVEVLLVRRDSKKARPAYELEEKTRRKASDS